MAEENKTATETQTEIGGENKQNMQTTETQAEDEKQFTQADIDNAVEKRLSRERKKWEREQQKQQSAPAVQQPAEGAVSTTQQLAQQPPKDDSAEKIAKANRRLVTAEAKAAAITAGAKPDRADYVVRLADLSKVDVDEDDGPDSDAIKKAIDKVLKDMPEFKATPDDGKGSGSGFQQIGADGSRQGTRQQVQQQVQNINPAATKRWNKFRQF